jgi:TetR/AcrR family transcriptional regulator, transcriptional repressor for nem operon
MTTPSTGARAAAKLATRQALIDAAIAELSLHGPYGASLDAICARAGKTRGAFYVHFADREALLVAAMDRMLGGLVRSVTAAGGRGGAGLAGGIRYFTTTAGARAPEVHAGRELRFHHVLEACRTSRAIGDRYRAIIAAASAWAAQAIAEEQRAGRLAGVAAGDAAQVLVAMALGVVAMLELGVPIDAGRLGDALVAMLGLAPRRRRRARRA